MKCLGGDSFKDTLGFQILIVSVIILFGCLLYALLKHIGCIEEEEITPGWKIEARAKARDAGYPSWKWRTVRFAARFPKTAKLAAEIFPPTIDQQMIETVVVSAKQESVSLEEEIVQVNSDNAELGVVENAKQENIEMSEDDQKMISSDSDNELIAQNFEDMYDVQEGDNLTNGGTLTTAGNEGEEGHDKYANIGVLLKAVETKDYEQYLDNFKREKVDDVRLEECKKKYSREHPLWTQLIPAFGDRQDFIKHLYAYAEI